MARVCLGIVWRNLLRHNADFSRTFSLRALYKHFFKNNHWQQKAFSSFQLTAVWDMKLAKGWVDFSGFADVCITRTCVASSSS